MGRKPAAAPACPLGVKVRQFRHEERIQIAFSFRGEECRELLPPGPINKGAIDYAAGLRAEIRRKIKDGVFVYAEYFPASPRAQRFEANAPQRLIGKLLQAQLETYERQVENGKLSPSTLAGYRKAINSERMAHWNEKTLAEATPSALRTWIGSMAVTAKFARNLLTPLRSVFEDALNDGLIEFDPFERIALAKLLKQTAKASDYVIDPFTAAERETLLERARADERPTVQFWFATGLRPGELQALRWSRIDLKARTARIDENQVERVVKGPKTDAGVRLVELSPEAMAALEAQKPLSLLAGEHVFLNPRTGKPWETDAQLRKTLWQPLCARAGLRYRNPYQVRHTYASAMLTEGQNPWYVAQQLGHVDVTMVFQVYGKFIAEDYQKPRAPKLRVVGGEG